MTRERSALAMTLVQQGPQPKLARLIYSARAIPSLSAQAHGWFPMDNVTEIVRDLHHRKKRPNLQSINRNLE